jgi:hypothetical protein
MNGPAAVDISSKVTVAFVAAKGLPKVRVANPVVADVPKRSHGSANCIGRRSGRHMFT